MPRKKWRQLLAFLSCGGLGRTKKSKHNDSAVAVEGTRSRNDTISINFERQEGDARETEVSNSPHAGIEVERFQGREATAHSHVQTIEVHQQWPPGDAQADLLGSDMQMKTVRDRAGATKVDVSNEVTDMASGNATTARAMTWKDMQSVAESTHDVDGETNLSLIFDLEHREVQETTSELSDLDKQGYCEPSSTSIGYMRVEPLTENVVSSFASTDSIQSTSTAAGNIQYAQLEQGKEEIPAHTDPLESECSPLEVEDVPPSAGLLNDIKPSRVNALAPTTDFPNMTGHGTDKLRRGDLSTGNRIPNSSETDTFRATTSDTVTSCITTACAADGTTASSTDATIKTTSSAAYAITGITGSTDRSKNFTADAQAITEIATTRTTATTTCAANDTKSTTATAASATGATMSTTATTTCTLDATTRIAPTAANVTNVPIGTMIPSASATMEINTSVIPLSTPNTTRGATTAPFNPEDVTIVSTTSSAASTAIKAVKEAIPVQPTGDEECPDTTDVENNMRTEADGSDRHLQTQTQGATADLPYENSQAADSSSAERLTRGRTWQQRSPKTRSKAASHLEDESKQRSVNITSNESTFSPLALSNRRSISGEVVISVNSLSKQNPRGECQPVPGTSNSSIKRNTSVDELPAERISSLTKPGNLMSTQGPSQHEGERDVRPKTSSCVAIHTTARPNPLSKPNTRHSATDERGHDVLANSYALPQRRRETTPHMRRSTSLPPATVVNIVHLIKKDPIADYHQVPVNIKDFVTQVAQDKKVECGAIYQSPEDPKELQIIGINATSMSEVVTETIEQFPGFTFLLEDCVDSRHLVEYGVDDLFDVSKSQYVPNARTENKRKLVGETMCGMILVGRTLDHHSIDAHYVVLPAHLCLQGVESDLREDALRKDQPQTVDQLRVSVDGRATYDSYIIKLHNSPKKLDVEQYPLFGYRYFYDPNSGCHTRWDEFINDIALLKIKPYQLMEEFASHPVITRKHLKHAMMKSKEFTFSPSSGSFEEHLATIKNIFPLRNRETLIEMGRQRVNIFVGLHVGHMVPCGESISTDGRKWASAIEFVFIGRKFQPGDCGLIVHVKDKRSPKELYPLGMFVGKSTRTHKCGLTVWVAVVLRQCIDEIEEKYRHLVSNLRPMEKTIDRDTDGERLVQNLNRNQLVVSQSGSCGDMGAAVTDSHDTGYGDTMPEVSSYNHSSTRDQHQV